MDIDENLIKEVVDRVLAVTQPEKIILFGSAATRHMGPDSDLDLLVIERGLTNAREESTRLRAALIGVDIPVDIFPMELERFEETKNVIGGLAYPANKYGVVIYEAPSRGEARIHSRMGSESRGRFQGLVVVRSRVEKAEPDLINAEHTLTLGGDGDDAKH